MSGFSNLVPERLTKDKLLATVDELASTTTARSAGEFQSAYSGAFLDEYNPPPSRPLIQAIQLLLATDEALEALDIALLAGREHVVHPTASLPAFAPDPSLWESHDRSADHASGRPSGWTLPMELAGEAPMFVGIPSPDDTHPAVAIMPIEAPAGTVVNYLFEFDRVASFDSPNCWRAPNLLTRSWTGDCWSRDGLSIVPNASTDRNATGASVEFPFRAGLMSLPVSWDRLSLRELALQASRIGNGLPDSTIAHEAFEFVRRCYHEAGTSTHRTQLDTFMTGLGQCGFVNGLGALFLELNGLRTRRVSGFNPQARLLRPGGGHTATEVLIDGSWCYWDPYLDIFDASAGVEEIRQGKSAYSSHPIFQLTEASDNTLPAAVTLESLFRYRVHGDYFGRFPEIGVAVGPRGAVGRVSAPISGPPSKALASEKITIHVRARAIFSKEFAIPTRGSFPEHYPAIAGATPWRATEFAHNTDLA